MIPTEIQQFMLDDGTIHYGLLMRYWRKHVMQWKSAEILADVYNEVLKEDEPLTARAIQRMEQQNKVPMDKKRRQLLATILNIPPAYFGLTALVSNELSFDEPHTTTLYGGSIDILEYTARLKQLWSYWSPSDIQKILAEIVTKIHALEETVLYGSSRQREQLTFLLCNYLVLYGNMRRDLAYSDAAIAITSLDKALKLAHEAGYYELAAKASYLKGYTQFDRWGIQPNRMTERTDLSLATTSFQVALKFAEESQKRNNLNGPLKSAIVAELGLVQAYNAQSSQEKKTALQMVDRASTMIQSHDFHNDPTFLFVNDEWYHIDKAEAYVALQQSYNAIDELDNVDRKNPQKKRRYVYTNIVEADAYYAKKKIEMAVACAESALDLLEETRSFIFVTRISNMYHELRQDKRYATSPDVARLGGKLLKIQHAYLFE
jgi:tetratricopeptide (TPR) repeat protein